MSKIFRGPERAAPTPNVSLGKFMYDKLKSHGNRPALICASTGQKRSYSELLEHSLRLSAGFRELGIREGEVVGFSSENTMDFYPVVLATFFTGATIAPINPTYIERELEHCLLISRPRLVIASPKVAARVAPVVTDLARKGELPREAVTLVTGDHAVRGLLCTAQLAGEARDISGLPVHVREPEKETAFIMCSSGTTGLPKGVELTHRNFLAVAMYMQDPRLIDLTPRDVLLGLLPFFHMYGLSMGLVALTHGCALVVMDKFQDELFLRSIQQCKVTVAFLVPPLIVFLGKSPLVERYDLSSLREIWSGAAPLSGEMQDAVTRRLGTELIRQGYGLTEATLAVTVVPLARNKNGASGKLVPGMMCKVLDRETGQPLGYNQAGELCFHGDLVMKGYKDNPAATDDCIDAAGWVHSGDVGYFDEDEYLFVVDRVKELIKYKGFQVAPAELEALLLTHPSIQDSAVIGKPDEQAGELPVAFVILQPGATLTEKQVIDFVAGQVSSSKRLHQVTFVKSIPKTASGKILRRELRENLQKQTKAKL